MSGDRDETGRFIKGNKASPGRKPRSVEEKYMETFLSKLTPKEWGEVTDKVIELAKAGNMRAIELLVKYSIGLPVQRAEVEITAAKPTPEEWEEWREVQDERVAKVEALNE